MSKQDAPAALRTRPEWLTLGVASAVLGCVLTALVVLSIRVDRPATPTVTIAPGIHERDGRFFVQVEVHNDGDRAAADVQVLAELVGPEGTVSSEQVIDFLGGGETATLTFVFSKDPASALLTVEIGSFSDP